MRITTSDLRTCNVTTIAGGRFSLVTLPFVALGLNNCDGDITERIDSVPI